jgi:hypothetical protein
MPDWLKPAGEKPSNGAPSAGVKKKVSLEQAKEMVRQYGSAAAAKKAAQEQGLEFE